MSMKTRVSSNSHTHYQPTKPAALCRVVWLLLPLWLIGAAGCGTNFPDLLVQGGNSAAFTAVDILLTDMANAFLDRLDELNQPPDDGDEENGDQDGGNDDDGGDDDGDDGDGDDDGDGGDDDGGDGGDDGEQPAGDPDLGEAMYAAENCGACHCDDASGGCAMSAPGLIGAGFDVLDEYLRGDAPHVGIKLDLTDQEIADLAAYLDSL